LLLLNTRQHAATTVSTTIATQAMQVISLSADILAMFKNNKKTVKAKNFNAFSIFCNHD